LEIASAAIPTLRTARRLRRIMMTEPLCRISDSIALHQQGYDALAM
jgi:hypothetical protein